MEDRILCFDRIVIIHSGNWNRHNVWDEFEI